MQKTLVTARTRHSILERHPLLFGFGLVAVALMAVAFAAGIS